MTHTVTLTYSPIEEQSTYAVEHPEGEDVAGCTLEARLIEFGPAPVDGVYAARPVDGRWIFERIGARS